VEVKSLPQEERSDYWSDSSGSDPGGGSDDGSSENSDSSDSNEEGEKKEDGDDGDGTDAAAAAASGEEYKVSPEEFCAARAIVPKLFAELARKEPQVVLELLRDVLFAMLNCPDTKMRTVAAGIIEPLGTVATEYADIMLKHMFEELFDEPKYISVLQKLLPALGPSLLESRVQEEVPGPMKQFWDVMLVQLLASVDMKDGDARLRTILDGPDVAGQVAAMESLQLCRPEALAPFVSSVVNIFTKSLRWLEKFYFEEECIGPGRVLDKQYTCTIVSDSFKGMLQLDDGEDDDGDGGTRDGQDQRKQLCKVALDFLWTAVSATGLNEWTSSAEAILSALIDLACCPASVAAPFKNQSFALWEALAKVAKSSCGSSANGELVKVNGYLRPLVAMAIAPLVSKANRDESDDEDEEANDDDEDCDEEDGGVRKKKAAPLAAALRAVAAVQEADTAVASLTDAYLNAVEMEKDVELAFFKAVATVPKVEPMLQTRLCSLKFAMNVARTTKNWTEEMEQERQVYEEAWRAIALPDAETLAAARAVVKAEAAAAAEEAAAAAEKEAPAKATEAAAAAE